MNKRNCFFGLLFLNILSIILYIILPINFLLGILIIFAIPSIYLCITTPKHIKKSILFSLISIPFVFIIDYLAVINNVWYIPKSLFRLLNIVAIEQFIWGFFFIFLITMYYETFFDDSKPKISKNIHYSSLILVLMTIIFIILIIFHPNLIHFKNAYLIIGLIFIVLPISIIISIKPNLSKKFLLTNIFFIILFLIYEIIALLKDHWIFFKEQSLFNLKILNIFIPIEELIFFVLISSIAVLCWYEFFADDKK